VEVEWYTGAGEYCPECGEKLTPFPLRSAPVAEAAGLRALPKEAETLRVPPKGASSDNALPKPANARRALPKAANVARALPKAANAVRALPKAADARRALPKAADEVRALPKAANARHALAKTKDFSPPGIADAGNPPPPQTGVLPPLPPPPPTEPADEILPPPRQPGGASQRGLSGLPYVATMQITATELGQILESRHARRWPLRALVLVSFVALTVIAGFIIYRPRIDQFVVLPTAFAGTAVSVVYRASGLGSARYTLLGPEGQTIADAPLTLSSGAFALSLPGAKMAQTYLLRLDVSNVLGTASAERYIRAPAEATRAAQPTSRPKSVTLPADPPQIRSLALDRASLASGDAFTVYYDVLADRGTIALFDPAAQMTYGKSEISPSGHTTFTAPHFDTERLLTVIVTAQRGNATTQSRVGVTVTPKDDISQSGAAATAPAGVNDDSIVTLTAPPSVHSRGQFRVDVHGPAAGLQLVLLDGVGNALARQGVSAGQTTVVFTAPAVAAPTRFLIEGTYPNGLGSETIVRAINVTP
jgi:hypothetical protein